jgi:hypothetical protein
MPPDRIEQHYVVPLVAEPASVHPGAAADIGDAGRSRREPLAEEVVEPGLLQSAFDGRVQPGGLVPAARIVSLDRWIDARPI